MKNKLLKSIFFLGLFFVANSAFAQMIENAGFTGSTILVSNTAPTVGDIVRMSMPIYNESQGVLSGVVRLYEGSKKVGEKSISIKVGEFSGFSYEWKAVLGTHTFVLKLEDTFIQVSKKNKEIAVLKNRSADVTLRTQGSSSTATVSSDGRLFKEYDITSESQDASAASGLDSYRQDFLYDAELKINSIRQDISESVKQNVEYEERLNELRDSLPRADGSLLTPLQYVYAWVLGAVAYILSNAYLFYGLGILAVFLILRFIIRRFRHGHMHR